MDLLNNFCQFGIWKYSFGHYFFGFENNYKLGDDWPKYQLWDVLVHQHVDEKNVMQKNSSLQDWTLDLCVQHVLNWFFYVEESELLHTKIEQFLYWV
jgi:hypothetical protein